MTSYRISFSVYQQYNTKNLTESKWLHVNGREHTCDIVILNID